MSGENLDITSEPELAGGMPAAAASAAKSLEFSSPSARPFIGVQFGCCQVYSRIYLNAEETAYQGHCPRCGRRVAARIGPEGQAGQFFTVS